MPTSDRHFTITEPRSGLRAQATLLTELAPENCAFLWDYLEQPRQLPALHAIWTGPEISFPLPTADSAATAPLPLENATCFPAAGDILLTYVAPRVLPGSAGPVVDLGLFYAPGGRTLLPFGLLPGSVVARVEEGLQELWAACGEIRRIGAVTFELRRA